MNLLSIQGKYAPVYQLDDEQASYFRHLIKAVTLKDAIVINSKFRTDIIYFDSADRNEEFLKAWSHLVGKEYDPSVKLKFFRAVEEKDSINNFLYRINLLKRMPKWYNYYYEKLINALQDNNNQLLCKKICMALQDPRISAGTLESDCMERIDQFISLTDLATQVRSSN